MPFPVYASPKNTGPPGYLGQVQVYFETFQGTGQFGDVS